VVSVKSLPIDEEPSVAAVGKTATESPAAEVSSDLPVPAVPAFAGPLPPSHAFTIWTDPAANAGSRRINQSIALAALIESRTSGAKAGQPSSHEPTVPPVPMVEHGDEAPPNHSPGTTKLPLLDLEPLSIPGEGSDR
jgi:hypothetical protein